jgi:hypothetical protein
MDILAQGGLAVLRDSKVAIRRNHGVEIVSPRSSPGDPGSGLIAAGGARGRASYQVAGC